MPRRWGTKTRLWAYRYLVLRDGEACARCGEIPTTRNTLDIDHRDGNPANDDPENLRLLCRRCNVSLENAARPTRSAAAASSAKCVRVSEEGQPMTSIAKEDAGYRQGSPEMQANQLFEVTFRRWVLEKAREQGYYKAEAINEGAELVGCSPATTQRYLAKLTSAAGPLEEQKDYLGHSILVLKPAYQPIRVNLDNPQSAQSVAAHRSQAHQERWSESEAD